MPTSLIRFPATGRAALLLCLGSCLLAVAPSRGQAAEPSTTEAGKGTLIQVDRIWDQAAHNAFTDLTRFQGKWYCVFREGSGHVSDDGSLRVLVSDQIDDASRWTSAAVLSNETADLRDAKITITPDQRLMLSGAGAQHDRSRFKHQSYSWFSSNGTDWSQPYPIGPRDFWLWRTTWHDGMAYSVGYATGAEADRHVRLFRSPDGKSFESLVDNLCDEGYPNESSLVFLEDDTGYCLLRRDGSPNTGLLGTSQPPYRDWDWQDLGVRIGGPHMIQIPDGRLIAAVRLYDGGARTALCWLDPEEGKLTEFLTLPSGGDTSYPGLVWHQDHLYVSYYSAHETSEIPAATAIYLAKVAIE